jgi:signal peptidase
VIDIRDGAPGRSPQSAAAHPDLARITRGRDRSARVSRAFLAGLILVATAYCAFVVATLVMARVVPAVAGWSTAAVIGGSMEPAVSAGDVIVLSSDLGEGVVPGMIIGFHNPAHPGAIVTHRVVGVNADGSIQTKGDANAAPDSTPILQEQVIGVVRMVVPDAGLPVYWWRTGRTDTMLAWMVLSAAALVLATRRLPGDPPSTRSRRSPVPGLTLLATLMAISVVGATTAVFSSATANVDSSLSAAWAAHRGSIGSGSCGGATTRIAVTEAAPAGRTVIITVALLNAPGAAVFAAVDSRGNSYTIDAVASDGSRSRVAIISGFVTTGLEAGDWIDVLHPGSEASAARADVFSGVAGSGRVITAATASGRSGEAAVVVNTASPDTLVVGAVATRDSSSITQAAPWTTLESGDVSCGSTLGRAAAWRLTHTASDVTYRASFSTEERWSAAAVVYRTISS